MDEVIPLGKKQIVGGQLRVYYYGYWVKAYEAPADTLLAKKLLIEGLARRLFNHCEHGINIPGRRLDHARAAYEAESDPERKRVKGAMLAGCIFNRATDIFTKLVEIQALGVTIEYDNALMRECGALLQESLTLGQMVLHRSGEEGLDELWGEPFKAFSFSIEDFYNSRYVKIAQTMRAIDGTRDAMLEAFASLPAFAPAGALLRAFADAAKIKCETLRTDPEIFEVWTSFVVSGERLAGFRPRSGGDAAASQEQASEGLRILAAGKALIYDVTRARVPMPKSAREFGERCEKFRRLCAAQDARSAVA
jgi:hypothetical protein